MVDGSWKRAWGAGEGRTASRTTSRPATPDARARVLPRPAAPQVLSAKVHKGAGGLTHRLKLQLSHGSMPDSVYEVCGPCIRWLKGACVGERASVCVCWVRMRASPASRCLPTLLPAAPRRAAPPRQVEVANPGGSYQLLSSQQVKLD